MSDQPDARGTPPPAGPGSSGPFYGPVHRHGRPAVELRDGPPTAPGRAWAPPAPAALPDPPPSAPPSGSGGPLRDDYAGWTRRVSAYVLDALPGVVAVVVLVAGYLPIYLGFLRGDLTAAPRYPLLLVGSVLALGALVLTFANRHVLAGRTGQSVGKRLTGIWLVHRTTGRPIGTLDAFVRDLLHVLDGLGGVGCLWPLWDEERQTLADKVAETMVVRTPVPPLTAHERRPL